jgi:hypothetical protein
MTSASSYDTIIGIEKGLLQTCQKQSVNLQFCDLNHALLHIQYATTWCYPGSEDCILGDREGNYKVHFFE